MDVSVTAIEAARDLSEWHGWSREPTSRDPPLKLCIPEASAKRTGPHKMQFFAQGGRESLAAQALAATTRSINMCQHLSAFDLREHEVTCCADAPNVMLEVLPPSKRPAHGSRSFARHTGMV